MPRPEAPRIALAPEGAPAWMAEAISDGGGHLVPLAEAEAIVWADPRNPDALAEALDDAPDARWVQLPFAGIENFVHLIDHDREWTCGKGVYAEPVAELALTLALAGMRGLGTYARADDVDGAAGTQPARRPGHHPRRRRHHASRSCGCCSRWTATSPSCAARPATSTASTTCSRPTATPTPCRAPISSCSRSP